MCVKCLYRMSAHTLFALSSPHVTFKPKPHTLRQFAMGTANLREKWLDHILGLLRQSMSEDLFAQKEEAVIAKAPTRGPKRCASGTA